MFCILFWNLKRTILFICSSFTWLLQYTRSYSINNTKGKWRTVCILMYLQKHYTFYILGITSRFIFHIFFSIKNLKHIYILLRWILLHKSECRDFHKDVIKEISKFKNSSISFWSKYKPKWHVFILNQWIKICPVISRYVQHLYILW